MLICLVIRVRGEVFLVSKDDNYLLPLSVLNKRDVSDFELDQVFVEAGYVD